CYRSVFFLFFFQAEDGIRDRNVTGVQTYALPISGSLTDLVSVLDKKVTVEEVNAAMQAAATESFGYNTDPIVSRDIVGISYGSRSEERRVGKECRAQMMVET